MFRFRVTFFSWILKWDKNHWKSNLNDQLESKQGIILGKPYFIVSPLIRQIALTAGCVVVSIPESFASSAVGKRLQISGAKAVFTQDYFVRSGKSIQLYNKAVHSKSPMAIVFGENDEIPEVFGWYSPEQTHCTYNFNQYKVHAPTSILYLSPISVLPLKDWS